MKEVLACNTRDAAEPIREASPSGSPCSWCIKSVYDIAGQRKEMACRSIDREGTSQLIREVRRDRRPNDRVVGAFGEPCRDGHFSFRPQSVTFCQSADPVRPRRPLSEAQIFSSCVERIMRALNGVDLVLDAADLVDDQHQPRSLANAREFQFDLRAVEYPVARRGKWRLPQRSVTRRMGNQATPTQNSDTLLSAIKCAAQTAVKYP